MRHFRPCLSLLVAAACAAGCVPAGMAPVAPAAVAARAITLDARQGEARALGRVDLQGRRGRTLLATIDPYTQASIDHLEVAIYEYDEGDGTETYRDKTNVEGSEMEGTLTFVGLRPDATYRVRATAFATPGDTQPISVADSSYVDFTVYRDNRLDVALVPVQLKDVPFNGRATSNGLDVRDGAHFTAGPAFITPGMAVDPEVVTKIAGDQITLASGFVDATEGPDARFFKPFDLAAVGFDLFVLDQFNQAIRKVSATGAVTTIAGLPNAALTMIDGDESTARFGDMMALEADGDGNLWVADFNPNTGDALLRKIAPRVPSGYDVTTYAGGSQTYQDGPAASARFYRLHGIAWDRDHSLYLGDSGEHMIRKLDLTTGVFSTVAGIQGQFGQVDGPGTSAKFWFPSGMAVDLDGNLLVCDTFGHAIRKVTFNADGSTTVSTVAGSSATSGDGTTADDDVGAAAKFIDPRQIAVDGLGNAYVTESTTHRIRKLTFGANGIATVTTFAGDGNVGGSADSDPLTAPELARFNQPRGMAFEPAGRLRVADANNHLIRAIGFTNDGGPK